MCATLPLPWWHFFSHSCLSALSECLLRSAFALFLHQLLAFHIMQSHSYCQWLEDHDVEIILHNDSTLLFKLTGQLKIWQKLINLFLGNFINKWPKPWRKGEQYICFGPDFFRAMWSQVSHFNSMTLFPHLLNS